MDCTLKGLVAGTCDANGVDYEITGIQFAAGDLESYLFSAEDNRDIWKEHDASRGHNLIVELLLCSGNASFRGFTRDENGSYSFTRSHEKINSDEVQQGILDFVKNFHIRYQISVSQEEMRRLRSQSCIIMRAGSRT